MFDGAWEWYENICLELVKYIYIDRESSSEGSMETYCIGKISKVYYQSKKCSIEFITIIINKDIFCTVLFSMKQNCFLYYSMRRVTYNTECFLLLHVLKLN